MKKNPFIILSIILCLLLTQYKRVDGFMSKDEYFSQAITSLRNESGLLLYELKDTGLSKKQRGKIDKKLEKINNAINYINYLKTNWNKLV